MTNIRLKISPPWITYVNEINALFQHDPDIDVVYDNDEIEVKLYVTDGMKASALDRLLPDEISYGNVTLKITIIPANEEFVDLDTHPSMKRLFDIVFNGNPIYAFSKEITGIFSNVLTYVVFKNRVVQFFNDNLNDIYGNMSTLYQEVAHEVIAEDINRQVCYCTDIEEKVGMPLGEWP